MNKIKQIVSSRTVWTVVVMFVINLVTAYHSSIPKNFVGVVDALLSVLAVYFHTNPSQQYSD